MTLATVNVTGTVQDGNEVPVVGAKIVAQLTTNLTDGTILYTAPDPISTTTASDGTWSLAVIPNDSTLTPSGSAWSFTIFNGSTVILSCVVQVSTADAPSVPLLTLANLAAAPPVGAAYVSSIIAGTGVTIDQATGAVTVSAPGAGIAVGDAVSGATDNAILATNGTGDLVSGLLTASIASTSTRTGLAALGVGPSAWTAAGGVVETAERRLVTLPVTTTQWRLRLSNYSDYSESAGAGTINIAGLYLGAPSFPIAGSRWIGDCAAAPALLDSGETLTLSAFGDCYVGPWITTAGEQFTRGVPQVLTLGLVSGSGTATLAYVEPGTLGTSGDAFFLSGSGASATAANAAAPASQIARQFLDWRIEYQYEQVNDDTPNVLVIGDSIAAGYVCTENPYADFGMVHENWPMAAALSNRVSLFNAGIGGSGLSRTAGGNAWDPAFISPQTSWRWQRTGVQQSVGSTVAPSAPAPFAHYDASNITSPPSSGSPLLSWNDLSGNGYNLVAQNTAAAIHNQYATGTTTATTAAVSTTAQTLFVAIVSGATAIPTISDSASNTWVLIGSAGSLSAAYYCLNPTTNASHTFTATATGGTVYIDVQTYTGVFTALDTESTAASGTPGTISPQYTDLVVTLAATTASSAPTGYTSLHTSNVAIADILSYTTGTTSPSWSGTTSWSCVVGFTCPSPTYVTGAQNGEPVAEFPSGCSMAVTGVPNWNAAFTVIAAMNIGVSQPGGNFYYIGPSASSGLGRSNQKMLIEPTASTSTLVVTSSAFSVLTYQQNSTIATMRHNGGGVSLSQSIGTASWTEIMLNGPTSAPIYGEVLIFNSVLTPAQTRAWEQYLQNKWMPPPAYSSPPPVTYDKAIIALGANDINGGYTLAEIEASLPNIVSYLQEQGIEDIYAATVVPWDFAAATETVREQFNAWLRTLPAGIVGVFDLDKEISLPPNMVLTSATLVSGSGGNPITVTSGTGINVGMTCIAVGGGSDGGPIPPATTVTVVSGTSITLSNNPVGAGTYTMLFTSPAGVADPDLLFDPPHPTRGGYQRMASIVTL